MVLGLAETNLLMKNTFRNKGGVPPKFQGGAENLEFYIIFIIFEMN